MKRVTTTMLSEVAAVALGPPVAVAAAVGYGSTQD
jgi:hypothetical protein